MPVSSDPNSIRMSVFRTDVIHGKPLMSRSAVEAWSGSRNQPAKRLRPLLLPQNKTVSSPKLKFWKNPKKTTSLGCALGKVQVPPCIPGCICTSFRRKRF